MTANPSRDAAPPKKRTRARRAAPAKTAREADRRWGFADAASRGSMDAYTAEHYAADVEAGVILPPEPSRGCPRRRPERECPACSYPDYYRRTWRRGEHVVGEACYDCQLWIEHVDREAFRREHGDERSEREIHRVDLQREAGEIAAREWGELGRMAGTPHAPLDWYELRVLIANVRRCLAAYKSAMAAC